MKRFIFNEKEPQNVAGHGVLKPGDVVELNEKEVRYIEQTGSTSFIPEQVEEDEPENEEQAPVRVRRRKKLEPQTEE